MNQIRRNPVISKCKALKRSKREFQLQFNDINDTILFLYVSIIIVFSGFKVFVNVLFRVLLLCVKAEELLLMS